MVLVDNLYNNLNKNNRGNLEIKTFLSSLAENNNDNLDEFKDKFLLHHDFYTKGKTEVNYDEFIDFFELLSTDYKEDIDFENYIKNSFNIMTNKEEQKENEKEEITDKNKQTKEFLECLDTIRNILIKQGPNGVIELLRNLRNVDQSKSNGIDIDEFVSVIDNLFKDNENKFSMDDQCQNIVKII